MNYPRVSLRTIVLVLALVAWVIFLAIEVQP